MVDPLGSNSSYTYNNRGDRLTETKSVTTASGLQISTTTWLYDANGQINAMTDALGHTTTYEYDKVGKQIAMTDALERKIQYSYDENGKLIEFIYPDDTPNDFTDNLRERTEIEVDGKVFDYPGSADPSNPERRNGQNPGEFLDEQRNRYAYTTYRSYALNYSHNQIEKIKLSIATSLRMGSPSQSAGYYSSIDTVEDRPFGRHCVNFVKSNLQYYPNNDLRFLYTQWNGLGQFPSGYETLVSALAFMSRNTTARRLPDSF